MELCFALLNALSLSSRRTNKHRALRCLRMASGMARAGYTTRYDCPLSPKAYSKWVQTEVMWSTPDADHKCLLQKPDMEIISIWHEDKMVSTALAVPTFAPLSVSLDAGERVFFLCNVITVQEHRLRGLARYAVEELMKICENRGATEMRLVAGPAGLPLYEKLGFKRDEAWSMQLLELKGDMSTFSVGRVVVANEANLEDAIKFEAEAFERRGLSSLDMQEESTCYVIVGDGDKVEAACWMRALDPLKKEDTFDTFIGPVIARSVELATEVVEGGIAHWRATHDITSVSLLVIRRGGDGLAMNAFEKLGFGGGRDVPFMRKALHGELPDLVTPTKLVFGMNTYNGT